MKVRIFERQRPVIHPHALLAALGGTDRAARGVDRCVTHEGEDMLRSGDLGDDGRIREIAMVLGDDFYTLVIAVGDETEGAPAIAAAVDATAVAVRLELGTRRRRYFYTPPPDSWQRFSLDGLDAHFYAPGHPRTTGCLSVYAAVPSRGPLSAWWKPGCHRELAHELGIDFVGEVVCDEPIAGPRGLAGRRVVLESRLQAPRTTSGPRAAPAIRYEMTCLTDREYWYPLVLIADAADGESRSAMLASVVESIEPQASARPPARASLAHWFAR